MKGGLGIRTLALGAALCLVSLTLVGKAQATVGDLVQLAGAAGCIAQPGNGEGCSSQDGLTAPFAVVVSPDGKNVYVAGTGTLAVFSRASDGSLSQLSGSSGCLEEGGGSGSCQEVRGISVPTFFDLAVSPDGKTVYWGTDDAIVVLQRNTSTGALTQLAGTEGCFNTSGSEECLTGRGGQGFGAQWITVSPDGAWVYAGSTATNSVLSEFHRNTATGALSIPASETAGCVSAGGSDGNGGKCAIGSILNATNGMAISPDGTYAYVTSGYDETIEAFKRTASGLTSVGAPMCLADANAASVYPGCETVRGMRSPGAPVLSPDGSTLYVPSGYSGQLSGGGVVALSRAATTGALQQLPGEEGCITETGFDEEETPGVCATGHGLTGTLQIAAAPDGGEIYATGSSNSDIAVLRRAGDGALSQPAGAEGCHGMRSNAVGCTEDRGMSGLDALAASTDGNDVYGATENGVVAFAREQPVPPPPPTPATGPPTIAITKAEVVGGVEQLSVEVAANGLDTNVFTSGQGGLPGQCGSEHPLVLGAPMQSVSGSAAGLQHLLIAVSGSPGFTGSIEVTAQNSAGGTTRGVTVAFPAPPPTGPYADVSGTTVTFHDVDAPYGIPSGSTHDVSFRYEPPATGLPSKSTPTDALAESWTTSAYCPVPIAKMVTGLQPGTTYHWRTVDDLLTPALGEQCSTYTNFATLKNETECWTYQYDTHDETLGPTMTFTTGLAEASGSATFTGTTITIPSIVCLSGSKICIGKLTVTVPGISCTKLSLGCHANPTAAKIAGARGSSKGARPKKTIVLARGSFRVRKHRGSAKLSLSAAGRRYLEKRRSVEGRLVMVMKGHGGKPLTTAAPLRLRRR